MDNAIYWILDRVFDCVMYCFHVIAWLAATVMVLTVAAFLGVPYVDQFIYWMLGNIVLWVVG